MQQIRVPRWPDVVNSSLNCHWSTAFISIKLEIPPIKVNITIDPMLPWNETLSAELDCSLLNAHSWNKTKQIKHIVVMQVMIDTNNSGQDYFLILKKLCYRLNFRCLNPHGQESFSFPFFCS